MIALFADISFHLPPSLMGVRKPGRTEMWFVRFPMNLSCAKMFFFPPVTTHLHSSSSEVQLLYFLPGTMHI